jgi:hypothetical protein
MLAQATASHPREQAFTVAEVLRSGPLRVDNKRGRVTTISHGTNTASTRYPHVNIVAGQSQSLQFTYLGPACCPQPGPWSGTWFACSAPHPTDLRIIDPSASTLEPGRITSYGIVVEYSHPHSLPVGPPIHGLLLPGGMQTVQVVMHAPAGSPARSYRFSCGVNYYQRDTGGTPIMPYEDVVLLSVSPSPPPPPAPPPPPPPPTGLQSVGAYCPPGPILDGQVGRVRFEYLTPHTEGAVTFSLDQASRLHMCFDPNRSISSLLQDGTHYNFYAEFSGTGSREPVSETVRGWAVQPATGASVETSCRVEVQPLPRLTVDGRYVNTDLDVPLGTARVGERVGSRSFRLSNSASGSPPLRLEQFTSTVGNVSTPGIVSWIELGPKTNCTFPGVLGAGESCELELVLHPQRSHLPAGQQAQDLEVLLTSLSNGYNGCTTTYLFCGNSLCLSKSDRAWHLRVTGRVIPAPAIQINGSGDFGLLALGQKSSRSVEIRNIGDIGSVLEGVVEMSGAGPVSIASGAGSYRLGSGQLHTVVLEAETSGWGSFTQELVIRSNTLGEPEKRLSLHAESVKAEVWLNTFIPWPEVPLRLPLGEEGPAIWCVQGDNRGFSDTLTTQGPPAFRSHILVIMDIANGRLVDEPRRLVGISHKIECGTADAAARYLMDLRRGGPRRVPPPTTKIQESAQADASCIRIEPARTPTPSVHAIRIRIECRIPEPAGPPGAPAIDADFLLHIEANWRRVGRTGRHDGFPAYEIYSWFTGQTGPDPVYQFEPRNPGEALALEPPMDIILPPIDVPPPIFNIEEPLPRERLPR